MKKPGILAAALAVSFGLATQAAAYSFAPKSTNFTTSGGSNVTISYNGTTEATGCTLSLTYSTDASGVATITAATFGGSTACSGVTATNLPWTWSATGTGVSTASSIGITGSFGTCSATTYGVPVNRNNSFVFENHNSCGFVGYVIPSPTMTIVNP